jgi:hypothetical protein
MPACAGKKGESMKIVIVKSPKYLRGILRRIFAMNE